jgi:hypothetical protein
MKHSIFWDMACSPLKVNRRFGGKCLLHLNIWGKSHATNHHEAGKNLFLLPASCWIFVWLLFNPEYVGEVSFETLVDFQRIICIISPKIRALPNHLCENMNSCLVQLISEQRHHPQ